VVGKIGASFNNSAGVYGRSTSGTAGCGVMGSGYYGVCGVSNNTGGYAAIYGSASSGAYSGYFVGGNGIYTSGNQTATGTKSAVVPIDAAAGDWRKLYCEEAAEVMFTDYGTGTLTAGHGHVVLDPIFLKTVTIDQSHPMMVFLEMNGETKGVYVVKGDAGFDVIENQSGSSNATFDYRVVARRRGYEQTRLETAEAPKPAIGFPTR